jgi:ribulose-5-phosphate 4-epimerase/fuculose-1-phosphate aldolase
MCRSAESGEAKAPGGPVADSGHTPTPADPDLIRDLVDANHILFNQKVVDAFGHVSVRHDKRPDRFLLSRNMAPARVTTDDIIEFDLDGNPINANGRPVYLERFIHSAIFKARPDVGAVVHSHSPAVIPFGVVKEVPLRAVFHVAGFLGVSTPIFEIRDYAGAATNMLIDNTALGDNLAQAFGDKQAVLMRGHGSTVIAGTLRAAIFRAVYLETNARLQSEAQRLGAVNYLTAEEAHAAAVANDGQANRAWDLWVELAQGRL